jgi:alkylated DNA repair dioxygenase AlkB
VENIHAFGPIIAGVSLCQPSYLTLRKIGDPKEKLLIYLEPRSLYVLASDSRYLWEHGVGKMNEIYNPRTQ